ncbi:hypothetical protein FB464_1426 [Subtercola boreus]|nr:hypothetical protein FB464_1426 [Subtercola boreus]
MTIATSDVEPVGARSAWSEDNGDADAAQAGAATVSTSRASAVRLPLGRRIEPLADRA